MDYKNYSEQELKEIISNDLDKDFKIVYEWEGKHFSGKNMRIDMLIKPRVNLEWANKDIVFGVEFKRGRLDEMNYVNNFIKQGIDYSQTYFNKLGYIPILLCPNLNTSHSMDSRYVMNMRHFLSSFNIGELYHTKNGLSIMYADKHTIWSQKTGVIEAKRYKLKTKFGAK